MGPTAQPALGPVASHLIPSSINAGVEMGCAAPPIRAFTTGKMHRRSQAACAFLGMLDVIGLAVIVNPIEQCGFRHQEWFQLLQVSSLDDFAHGIWWPRRTAEYFARFGIPFSRTAALSGTQGRSASDVVGTVPPSLMESPASSPDEDFVVVAEAFLPGQRPPSFAQTFAKPKATVHFMDVPWPVWDPELVSAGIDVRYEWIKGAHHTLLLWIACNLLFFVSLISFDAMLRSTHPSCPRLGSMPWSRRITLYRILWGGPTPIPSLSASQLVTHDPHEGVEMRRPLVVALSQIVGVWPRAHIPPPPSVEEGPDAFFLFEHRVWVAFLLTWHDYLRRPPPFPVPIPKDLPFEFSHLIPSDRS